MTAVRRNGRWRPLQSARIRIPEMGRQAKLSGQEARVGAFAPCPLHVNFLGQRDGLYRVAIVLRSHLPQA